MSTHAAEPVGGSFWTPATRTLAALGTLGLLLLGWRFASGLGATTALNDGYPWGIWIAFDMVVGTALATGGYGIALLVYVLNRGRYHRMMRSALLVSALGYTLGGIAVVIDLGRYWNMWKLPMQFWRWNLDSILLEVALCVMLYTLVLWIEVSPAFLERWKTSARPRLRTFAQGALPRLERALPWLLALGILLPTMHQSSLGSLMLLSGWKLHPLWSTPLLPLLFLVSCLAMGYAAVVMESLLSSTAFRRPLEMRMLAPLSGIAAGTLAVYAVLRLADLAVRGRLPLAFAADWMSLLFWTEMALCVVPLAMLWPRRLRTRPGNLFRAAMLIAVGGVLYRFSTFLLAYAPGAGWRYFPSVTEMLVTVGLVALEILAYVALVKHFPILGGTGARRPLPVPATEPGARPRIPVPALVTDVAHTGRGEAI